MTTYLTWRVDGTPIPQPRPRVTTRGGHGHAYTPAKHPVHDWRKAVEETSRAALWGADMEEAFMHKPLRLNLAFFLPRPKSHFKSGKPERGLTAKAPRRPTGARSGDCDNLAKAVMDALHGVLFVDDSWVVDLRVVKAYTESAPGVEIGPLVLEGEVWP